MSCSNSRFKQLYPEDMELLAVLAEQIHQISSTESFLSHLYLVLNAALTRKIFSVDSYSVNPVFFEQAISEGASDDLLSVYRAYMHQHPLLGCFLPHGEAAVCTILSETSEDRFRATDLYQKFYKVLGIEDQLAFALPHPGGVFVVVYSRDTAFTEREQLFMELLKPQLQIALKNWLRICELEKHLRTLEQKNRVSLQARDAGFFMDRLSPRQQAVAEQVALGFENRQIARMLDISPKTVEKHLENIFRILEIHNRTALATMWLRSLG